ncbi:hypothetical protein QTH91_00525 [Variovorax dokdonensis]|uniref:Uncharacterized protein n=1 Tax=Variovorax dokdonensis TaxID=344883 RepID=A0ABT7N4W2_9BURK|nr:hypothetical protein [Variovorax dokdonensis]MDM0042953.1 hypothetical protein [Variovorax dokdonensis]
MIRALLFLLSALVAIALGYFFGVWVLFGLLAAVLATLLLSTRREPHAREPEPEQDLPSTSRADP